MTAKAKMIVPTLVTNQGPFCIFLKLRPWPMTMTSKNTIRWHLRTETWTLPYCCLFFKFETYNDPPWSKYFLVQLPVAPVKFSHLKLCGINMTPLPLRTLTLRRTKESSSQPINVQTNTLESHWKKMRMTEIINLFFLQLGEWLLFLLPWSWEVLLQAASDNRKGRNILLYFQFAGEIKKICHFGQCLRSNLTSQQNTESWPNFAEMPTFVVRSKKINDDF